MAERMKIEIPRLGALKRLLTGDDLLAEPWREGMKAIAVVSEQTAISRGPIGPTGRTVAMMTHRVDARSIPLYAVIKTTARNPRNQYPYPKRIEYDPRSRRAGWFHAAIAQAASSLWPGILDRTAEKIAAKWRGLG